MNRLDDSPQPVANNNLAALAAAAVMAATVTTRPTKFNVITWPANEPHRDKSLSEIGNFWTPRVEMFVSSLRDRYDGGFECLISPELDPEARRPHLHMLSRGNLRLGTACRLAEAAGLGRVTVEDMWDEAGATTYVVKMPLLALRLEPDQRDRLFEIQRELSGGRGLWITKGYWLDAKGNEVEMEEALTEAEPLIPEVESRARRRSPAECLPDELWDHVLHGSL